MKGLPRLSAHTSSSQTVRRIVPSQSTFKKQQLADHHIGKGVTMRLIIIASMLALNACAFAHTATSASFGPTDAHYMNKADQLQTSRDVCLRGNNPVGCSIYQDGDSFMVTQNGPYAYS